MYHYTALITCLAAALLFTTGILVARARARYGVKVPATTGNADFERVYRTQINTLEWMPIFLPSLWLFAIYHSDAIAAAIGAVWLVGRVIYVIGYMQAAEKRSAGFAIQALAATVLWFGATGAILWRIVH